MLEDNTIFTCDAGPAMEKSKDSCSVFIHHCSLKIYTAEWKASKGKPTVRWQHSGE